MAHRKSVWDTVNVESEDSDSHAEDLPVRSPKKAASRNLSPKTDEDDYSPVKSKAKKSKSKKKKKKESDSSDDDDGGFASRLNNAVGTKQNDIRGATETKPPWKSLNTEIITSQSQLNTPVNHHSSTNNNAAWERGVKSEPKPNSNNNHGRSTIAVTVETNRNQNNINNNNNDIEEPNDSRVSSANSNASMPKVKSWMAKPHSISPINSPNTNNTNNLGDGNSTPTTATATYNGGGRPTVLRQSSQNSGSNDDVASRASTVDDSSSSAGGGKKKKDKKKKDKSDTNSSDGGNGTKAIITDGSVPAGSTVMQQQNILANYFRTVTTASHPNRVRIAKFGNVPQVLCACSDSSIHCYSLKDGTILQSLEGHTDRVISLAVSNPFYIRDIENNLVMKSLAVSGSRDEHIKIWDLENHSCLYTIHAHKSVIWSVAIAVRWNGDVIVITTGADGVMKSWNGVTGKRLITFKGHTDKILSVCVFNAISEHSIIFSGGADKVIRAWDLDNGRHIKMFEGHTQDIETIVVDTFTNIAALQPIVSEEDVQQQNESHPAIEALGSSKSLILVSGSKDTTIRVWDFRTGLLLFELTGHTRGVFEVSVIRAPRIRSKTNTSSNQQLLATAGTPLIISAAEDGTVRLWNMINGKLLKTCRWHGVNVRSIDTAFFFADNGSVGGTGNGTGGHRKQGLTKTATNENSGNTSSSMSTHDDLVITVTCGWDKTIQVHDVHQDLLHGTNRCTIS
jgi:WD40 repeat protein